MDGHEAARVATALNLFLCFAVGVSAMCRLNAIHARVMLRHQALYVFLFVASVFSGLRFFFFGALAGWGDVLATCGILLLLWSSAPGWREGPPVNTLTHQ